ncbi:MAG: glycosyl transferase [Candidatus Tagabacteria bacterium CG10_big_fil_rev_8_21_14_0_10_40_13]|uniref:Glycosyl transferase n=2 Tax=Candidatus Tagaibacteriota TaxID=1817918 RepID=A0A2M8L8Q5_9BACT|nr:MAG: glycosyl transferase [Candidatus Tagabacteria bacterium CG10_big_fil_rev_8_21_14_0_10_40_13]
MKKPKKFMKKLSIIIPVFNEKGTVREIIKRAISAPALDYQKEIIVVDDGSSDGTEKILENLRRKFNFLLLRHPQNLGKGAAIKTALKRVTGDIILTQDADLEYDPNDYQELLRTFSNNSPVVYGSRNLGKAKRGYFLYSLGGRFLTAFLNTMYGSNLTDINTGYKLFRTDIIKNINLESNGFEFCEEVTAKILKSGYSIKEIPIHYYPRKISQGKKIKFRDGLIALLTITKYRII